MRASNSKQDREFIAEVLTWQANEGPAHNILEDVTEWIELNMAPQEVFADEQLEQWAEDNGYEKK